MIALLIGIVVVAGLALGGLHLRSNHQRERRHQARVERHRRITEEWNLAMERRSHDAQ